MISAEQNELMTRIGPGTPAGKLLRRYWQPVALKEELDGDRPVKAVRLLAENLVLYKAGKQYSLLQRHCPHRGADLAFGRIEADGLRCSFHGWKFDGRGKCVETPAEPEGSRMCEHIRTVAYPVVERSGILF
ncbi:MAG TPA: Rieske 2Fe-2S domain-containing protein, partial [Burkholderiales bacterium]|nr:Rieske 2Fe-2S domain-containing protein [Burkholderiales bacterium]